MKYGEYDELARGAVMAGFAEQPQSQFVPDVGPAVTAMLRLGPGGRVVIPATMRDALGLKPGDALLAVLDNKELRMTTLADRIRELQTLTNLYIPEGVSLADELIADRRAEAAREDAEPAGGQEG